VRHFFWRTTRNILKTSAHTLTMPRKRKPRQSYACGAPSLKMGRPTKAYTIDDAVKLVSLHSISAFEVDMVLRVLIRFVSNFSPLLFLSLHTFYTAKLFEEGNS
jgi:hypothetical protein